MSIQQHQHQYKQNQYPYISINTSLCLSSLYLSLLPSCFFLIQVREASCFQVLFQSSPLLQLSLHCYEHLGPQDNGPCRNHCKTHPKDHPKFFSQKGRGGLGGECVYLSSLSRCIWWAGLNPCNIEFSLSLIHSIATLTDAWWWLPLATTVPVSVSSPYTPVTTALPTNWITHK